MTVRIRIRNPFNQTVKLASGLIVLFAGVGLLSRWDRYEQKGTPAVREATTTEVFFSPHGGAAAAIIRELGKAQKSIYVQAYSFTSAPIASALVEAHKRGVNVNIILDKSQRSERYSSADFVAHAGISTAIDSKHSIAHNKVIIVDDGVVLTGSFNFSKAAEESNAENLLVLRDVQIVQQYLNNWKLHQVHSEPYLGR